MRKCLTEDHVVKGGVEHGLELLVGDLPEDGQGPHRVQPHVLREGAGGVPELLDDGVP